MLTELRNWAWAIIAVLVLLVLAGKLEEWT